SLKESTRVKELIAQGNSYPTALSLACREQFGEKISSVISSPNNTLAIEYIKAINEQKLNIKPICIKRKGVAHDSSETAINIASASLIRQKAYNNQSFKNFLPYDILDEVLFDMENMTKAVLFKFKSMTINEILEIPDCNKELALRIFEYLKRETPANLSQLYDSIKTKNITHARIRRVILYGILGIKKEDFNLKPYGRILAINTKGTEILSALSKLKEKETMAISHSLSKLSKMGGDYERLAQLDVISSEFQKLCTKENIRFPNEYSVKFEKTK
ncbi:MAG: nucleotidyltransferase family protein, partial [Clostridiales bacterium]|nr:nucleotidyltransferase family protein [Clostridiales bacterium]